MRSGDLLQKLSLDILGGCSDGSHSTAINSKSLKYVNMASQIYPDFAATCSPSVVDFGVCDYGY